MFSIAGVYFYFQWQEKKAEEEAHRRRQEMYDRKRAHFEKTTGNGADSTSITRPSRESVAHPFPPNDTDQAWQEAMSQQSFSFRSRWRADRRDDDGAIIFGLVHLGGASNAATLLSFVALIGLIVHALGFDPPNIVVLGWWIILVLYVMLSVAAARCATA